MQLLIFQELKPAKISVAPPPASYGLMLDPQQAAYFT
jgi:hypothetical protein